MKRCKWFIVVLLLLTLLLPGCVTPSDANQDSWYQEGPFFVWNGVAWVQITQNGGGGVTDITYADLVTAIGSSGLIIGSYYRIIDYATIQYVIDGYSTRYDEILTGPIEPLIVFAVSINTIDKQALSEAYPQDIIYYDWNSANWTHDISFAKADTDLSIVTGFKGVITYREDTLLKNSVGYDFRNIKFRRWETSPPEWDVLKAYTKGDYVKKTTTTHIVYCALQNTIAGTVVTNIAFWVALINLNVSLYWNATPGSWNGIDSGVAYVDFKTFAEGSGSATYEKQVYSNHFAGVKDDYVNYNLNASLLPNNVIFLKDSSWYVTYANNIDFGSYNNTIDGNDFHSNTIGNGFYSNTIGNNFLYNTIGNNFFYNTIGNNFFYNTIGNNFFYNTIGNDFCSNTIGNNFYSNTIGNDFLYNTIGNDFYSNTIGNNFFYNTIGNGFYSNTIGNDFNYNQVEDSLNVAGGIDFSLATYVYANYNKTLFRQHDGTPKLRYFNDSSLLVVVGAND